MNLELLLEAERRGILPPEQQAILAEARRRGIVPNAQPASPPPGQQARQSGPTRTQQDALADAHADLARRARARRDELQGGQGGGRVVIEHGGKLIEFPDEETARQYFTGQPSQGSQQMAGGDGVVAELEAELQRRQNSQQGGQSGATYEQYMNAARNADAAGDTDAARRLVQLALKARQGANPQQGTNALEQTGIGVNEGLANMAGFPVDAMTGAINMGARGINAIAGTDLPQITDPVGGSAFFNNMRQDVLPDRPPENTGQRYARRIGQEVGAAAIPGGAMMRTAQAPMQVARQTTGAAIGSGIGGQTSREIAPDSDLADFVASALGGGAALGMAHRMQPKPKAPTLQELEAQRDAAYEAVRGSNARLSPTSADQLAGSIEGTLGPRQATRRLNPKAAIASDEIAGELRTAPPTIAEIDESRRWIGQNVAGSAERGERRIGAQMKGAIDSHLDNLTPDQLTGTNRGDDIVATLKDGREKAHRIHKSQVFEAEDTGQIAKGLRRAATTGTGGNEVNALRQNVRRVLENPKLRQGFSKDELQAMRDIADGTPTQNALRMLSRIAPSAGALPMTGGMGGVGAFAATGNPLFAIPSAVGEGAKYAAERSTRKQINQLGETIRNGGPLPKKQIGDATRRALVAWLSSRSEDAPPPQGATADIIKQLMGAM